MMKSPAGRVAVRHTQGVSPGVTLPFVLLLCLAGCRDVSSFVEASPAIPFQFNLTRGDYFRYNNWQLDEYGYRITASRFRSSWTVVDTGRSYENRSAVTFVIDSVFAAISTGRDSLMHLDTLYLHLTPEGDLEQFGFLASLLGHRQMEGVSPSWDRIAAFSTGASQKWVVGYADTAKAEPVYGLIETQRDFVAVDVDGTQMLLLAYRVDIDSRDLEVTIWITETPPAILRIRDESLGATLGTLKEIESLRSAGG